jgi:hypothetical protein
MVRKWVRFQATEEQIIAKVGGFLEIDLHALVYHLVHGVNPQRRDAVFVDTSIKLVRVLCS